MNADLDLARRIYTVPATFKDEYYAHELLAELARTDSMHFVDVGGWEPHWMATSHATVAAIERDHETFINSRGFTLRSDEQVAALSAAGIVPRALTDMDGQDHLEHRKVTADWLTPKSLDVWRDAVGERAHMTVERMTKAAPACDFSAEISMWYPLQIILWALGLPDTDYDQMLTLTQQIFGEDDPELRREGRDAESMSHVVEFMQAFSTLAQERRERPRGDLSTAIAQGRPFGEQIGDAESLWYFIIIATAGHDTTSAALSGGVEALLRFPDQLERLRADRSLVPSAVDEILRWVTPVKHFARVATRDVELDGKQILQGQKVVMSYPAANRDPAVFDRPHVFDVGRTSNRHLAFGQGRHYCVGAQLARFELAAFLNLMLDEVESIELDGDPVWKAANFVGGLRHLPVRYRMRG